MTTRFRLEFSSPLATTLEATIGRAAGADLAEMDGSYEVEVVYLDKVFTVYYDQRVAMGDDQRPVRGDVTGDYEVVCDGKVILRQHVSPHGTSGYGNPYAKSWSAERVGEAIARFAESRRS